VQRKKRQRREDPRLTLNLDEKRIVLDVLANALQEGFDIDDAGELPLSMLLDEITKPLANIYYNRGVSDAVQLLATRLEDLEALKF